MNAVYETNYKNLNKIVGDVSGFMEDEIAYKKIKSRHFLDLHIKRIDNNKISLCFYNEEIHGLVPYMNIEIVLNFKLKRAFVSKYQYLYLTHNISKAEERVKTSINKFFDKWVRNFQNMGIMNFDLE